MEKALAIIHHYGPGNADFVIRASGKLEWNGPGLEPTEEELERWEQERLFGTSLESQKATCIQLLNDSEKAVSNDPPYPDDVEAWKTFRASLRAILKSDQLETVPKKPF